MLDIKTIRSHFPILDQSIADGLDLVYLDNAATTQKPLAVIDAIASAYRETNGVNASRGHFLARASHDLVEQAREQVAGFIGCAAEEITFCRGTTEAINLVAQGLARNYLQSGDEILVSAMEHHSNIVPWQMVCHSTGTKLKVLPIDHRGELELDAFSSLLSSRTKLISLVHTSNSLGTVNPVKQIIEQAKKHAIPVLLDGAQTVAHETVNVRELNCDFYTFSGHKLYGPTGIGALYVRSEWLERLEPMVGGCGSHHDVTFWQRSTIPDRSKMDTGIAPSSSAAGLDRAIEFLNGIGMDHIQKQLTELLDHATGKLEAVPGLKIIGNSPSKTGIISFTLSPIHPHDIGTFLDQDGIAVRTGHHCTLPVMQFFEVPGTVRASFAIYNTFDEIDHLADSLTRIRKYFDG